MAVPELLRRAFSAAGTNQKRCGDLSGLPTDEGKLCLAMVLDLASRRTAGSSTGEHQDAHLARSSFGDGSCRARVAVNAKGDEAMLADNADTA